MSRTFRNGLIAIATAAVIATLSVTVPALASGGAAHHASQTPPVIVTGVAAGRSTPDTLQPVAFIALSAGKWTVFAKSYVHSSGSGNQTVHCELDVGSSSGAAATDTADLDLGSPVLDATMSLNASGPVSGGNGALLQCSDNGGDSTIVNTTLTAIKAGTLTVKRVT